MHRARRLRARRIDVDYASHSVAVEAIREQLAEALVRYRAAFDPHGFFSTVTGGSWTPPSLDADYWFRNIRQTVEFDQAVRTASASGYRTFIESSPHPALIAGIEDTVTDCGWPTRRRAVPLAATTAAWTGSSLRPPQAFVSGVTVDWRARVPRRPASRAADVCL